MWAVRAFYNTMVKGLLAVLLFVRLRRLELAACTRIEAILFFNVL